MSGPKGGVGDQTQILRGRCRKLRCQPVERREAQPLRRGGARPRAGLANLPCRRAERTLARSVRGLASPWRLPALHFPSGNGKRGKAYPAPFKQQGGGACLTSIGGW